MISILFRTLFSALRSRRAMVLENLALRHQLHVLQRNANRPLLTNRDRVLWVMLSRVWADWRTFLLNHASGIVSVDYCAVPTATFRVLFVFRVLGNERRRIVHFNVTDSPSAIWIGQQIVDAFPGIRHLNT